VGNRREVRKSDQIGEGIWSDCVHFCGCGGVSWPLEYVDQLFGHGLMGGVLY
jgi:hypothetical protein